jgi:hypothetical protein
MLLSSRDHACKRSVLGSIAMPAIAQSMPGGKRLAFYVALNIEHFAFGGRPRDRSGSQQPADRAQFRLSRLRQPGRPATIL